MIINRHLTLANMAVAILTGDVVNSTGLTQEQRKKLEQVLWETFEKIEKQKNKYDVLRGDSFQLLVDEPQEAFRKAVQLRCLVKSGMSKFGKKKADIRVSIGIGEISFKGKTLGSSDGTAFRRSGQGLDELKDVKKRFAVKTGDEGKDEFFEILAVLTDVIISGWSPAQAEAVYWSSCGKTQMEISEILSIVQSAVNKRLQSAHWNEIHEVITFFESTLSTGF